MFSYTLLGLSTNYTTAFIARALAGLCAGITPVTKALMKDMTDNTNYSVLFSYCGIFHSGIGTGLGSLIGPLIGGLLSNPNESLFSDSKTVFFAVYPYSLPNIF